MMFSALLSRGENMAAGRRFNVIGLMSGTSMDGIDAAVLETDGDSVLLAGGHRCIPYPTQLRRTLLRLPTPDVDLGEVERVVTDLNAEAVRQLCAEVDLKLTGIDLVGFHGQTIQHEPEHGRTWQLGDGQRLADALGCVVINQFRQNDLDHGGQGAPLAPAYHRALVRSTGLAEPVAVLNIGEDVGWSGDAVEAQAFAYLAARSALQWPLSWPSTTGVSAAVTGGIRWEPAAGGARTGT
jgi:anhydro-N-acetylmuramic acid kinase